MPAALWAFATLIDGGVTHLSSHAGRPSASKDGECGRRAPLRVGFGLECGFCVFRWLVCGKRCGVFMSSCVRFADSLRRCPMYMSYVCFLSASCKPPHTAQQIELLEELHVASTACLIARAACRTCTGAPKNSAPINSPFLLTKAVGIGTDQRTEFKLYSATKQTVRAIAFVTHRSQHHRKSPLIGGRPERVEASKFTIVSKPTSFQGELLLIYTRRY